MIVKYYHICVSERQIIYVQVRHAQGIHNIASDKDRYALSSDEFFDAQLTPLGWNQVPKFYVIIFLNKRYLHKLTQN